MSSLLLAGLSLIVLFVLLAVRVPIAVALGGVSLAGLVVLRGPDVAMRVVASVPYESASHWTLSAIPMFLLMGSIAYRSGLTTSLFAAARVWLSWLPGGLALAANGASAVFAAASGSSVATAAAMGRLTVPEMLKAKYDPGLATGAVAAAGTLGAMIPPSIAFVLFGWFTETSIAQLLIAGVVPGILTAIAFGILIAVRCTLNPALAPRTDEHYGWRERIATLRGVWPTPLLIVCVIGGIYSGLATPTEAGALGAACSLVIAAFNRSLNWAVVRESVRDTLHSGASIFLIAASALLFTRFLSMCGLPGFLGDLVATLDPHPLTIVLFMVGVYVVLGMFLDPIGILLVTLPVLLPLWKAADMDMVWLGVIAVKLLEIGLLTPPVGLNAFVLKSVIGDQVPLATIFRGLGWFIAVELLLVALLVAFPSISLWLPRLMA